MLGAGILSVLLLRLPALAVALATAAALGACLVAAGLGPVPHDSGLFRQRTALPQTFSGADALFESRNVGRKLLFFDDDPNSTIAVAESNSRSLITNGKSDGNLRFDYTTMALAGLVPALLCDDPSRAFVIGWGLGITAGALGSLDDVKEVVAAEISPRSWRPRRSSTRATSTHPRTRRSAGSAPTPTARCCAARANSA